MKFTNTKRKIVIFVVTIAKNKYNSKRMKGNSFSVGKVQGGNNGRAKKCKCIETGEVFNCAKDASLNLGFKTNVVASVCRGTQKTAKGFHFVWC